MRIPATTLALPQISNIPSPFSPSPLGSAFMKSPPQGETFLDMVETIGKSTRDSLVRAEKLSREAALGDADPQQVTFEVLKSKAALHQLTVLVNTTLQACQELLRMGV